MKVSTLKGAFPVVFLTVVVCISVALLSFIDSITREQIECQEDEQIKSMLEEMFPDISDCNCEDDIYIIYSDGALVGYAFLATGQGYGGEISILVGLEDETTVKGIKIISQSETPGLGSRVTGEDFITQFAAVDIDDVALTQDGGQIDAITGATISSRAVVEAVRDEAMEKVRLLREGE